MDYWSSMRYECMDGMQSSALARASGKSVRSSVHHLLRASAGVYTWRRLLAGQLEVLRTVEFIGPAIIVYYRT